MFSFATPSPICGLLLQLRVSLDDLFHPIFSHLTPGGPLPTRNKGDTIRRMMRHLSQQGDLLKKITSIPMRRNTENLQMMGI